MLSTSGAIFSLRGFLLAGFCLGQLGCASLAAKKEPVTLSEVKLSEPQRLRLNMTAGRVETVRYHALSATRSSENQHVLREHQEELDFTVRTQTEKVDAKQALITVKVETVKKDGEGDLNAMAYPELGQNIKMTLKDNGQVFQVAGYPSHSIFYVPSVSLSSEPVGVGDTWSMNADWMTSDGGVPLRLQLATILKRYVQCGAQQCAELEVSGDVGVPTPRQKKVQYRSEVRGTLYFGVKSGSVIGSVIRIEERLLSEAGQVNTKSCLESTLIEPESEKFNFQALPSMSCQASAQAARLMQPSKWVLK